MPLTTPDSAQDATQPLTRRQARQKRRESRAKRREERVLLGGVAPDPVVWTPSVDELEVFDRSNEPAGHVIRDLWRPSAAFLVGGGPSLNSVPSSAFLERGVTSLGINNAAGYVRTSAVVFSDPPYKFHHGIMLDPKVIKLIPRGKLSQRVRAKLPDGRFQFTKFRMQDCPNVWGFHRHDRFEPSTFLTAKSATAGNNKKASNANGRPRILFTFFLALRLLHYLGVRRVYLIGVDFDMTVDDGQGYAFAQDRWSESVTGNQSIYSIASQMLAELRPVFDSSGFEVYNCNPQSRLSVYRHVPFDVAMKDCRGMVPEEPFDLSGWYEKGEILAEARRNGSK